MQASRPLVAADQKTPTTWPTGAPLLEPVRIPIAICRSCGACVTEANPSPCQQERCAAWSSGA